MDNSYECLNKLSFDLEKEIETQKELSIRIKTNLSLPYPQAKQIQKLLSANQRCSMEFHRVMQKLKVPSFLSNMVINITKYFPLGIGSLSPTLGIGIFAV